MADNEQKQYPRGQIGINGGDLQQTTSFEFDYVNNGKNVHVLRKKGPSGFVMGNQSVTFTGEMVVDEDGPEIDLFKAVSSGTPLNVRIKLPGSVTKQITGIITNIKGRVTLEDGVQFTYAGTGGMVES